MRQRDRPSLVLVNQGAPYQHRRWDYGVTLAVNMDRAVLDVPMDVVVRASQKLAPTSPLHDLICGYLTHLHAVAVQSRRLCRISRSAPCSSPAA